MSEFLFEGDPKKATPKDLERRIIEARENNLRRIIERNPTEIHENYDRAVQALEAYHLSRSRIPVLRRLFGGVSQLHKKADLFYSYYDTTVFDKIGHTASVDLGPTATLRSPERLAFQAGLKESKGHHSNDLDRTIGNTHYVFAGLDATPSRSYSPRSSQTYYIAPSTPGYAVPIDIVDIKWPYLWSYDITNGGYEYPHLQMYADNIFDIPDFKRLYALYNATIFNEPQEAINFYKTQRFNFECADCWLSDQLLTDWFSDIKPSPPLEPDNTRMGQMRDILINYGIYPPVAPEFQYRDEVLGSRYQG
jgi:hypothetical protein